MRTIVIVCLLGALTSAQAQKIVKKIDRSVTAGEIQRHMYFFASDELRGRNTATQENKIAARYIAEQFRSNGVRMAPGQDSYFQQVPLLQNKVPSRAELQLGDSTFLLWEDMIFLSSAPAEVTGELAFVNYGFEKDLEGLDLEGKILVAIAGTGTPGEGYYGNSIKKRSFARAAGAVALIELYRPSQYPWALLVNYLSGDRFILDEGISEVPFNSMWFLDGTGERLALFKSMEGKELTLKVEGAAQRRVEVPNVIGYVEGTDPSLKGEYVLISAHLDHVGVKNLGQEDSIWNGARDNGIGIVNMLATARFFSENPPKRSIIFLACNAEEVGLLGSRWYADHPWFPLNKTVFNMNTDTGGYNDTSKVTITGFNRTSITDKLVASSLPFGLTAIDDPLPEENYYDRSDNVSFAAKGVPAVSYAPGYTEMNEEITNYYHQPTDEPHTLNYNYLTKYSKSFIYALNLIANTTEEIFWTPGDKYEQAGKILYNRQ